MSTGEKTEQPTAKKLRDARQKGQVAQSKDVSSTALLIVMMAFLFIGGKWIFETLQELVTLPGELENLPFEEALGRLVDATVNTIMVITLPIAGLVVVFGILVNYLQIGPLFVMEPLKPELKKLNPVEKVKQIFSMKNLIEFIKSSFKVLFLGFLIYFVIRSEIPNLVEIPYVGLHGAVTMLVQILFRLALFTCGAYIVVAVFDLFFQRWQHNKQLKMTKDEVKREYKEMEGDPVIKGKRKQLHQEMVMSGAVEQTKKATVLVTNPTHRAIAIYYKEGDTKLPMIMAKGEGILAKRMMEAAKEAGVPIMQNVPLATDLWEHGDVEQYIPVELIEPIAEVLRWVRELQAEQERNPYQ
ncbi:EscU/YscU/HrcU family type III secretion system export apparatus switch protein [bacterium]|nr:EscU/YscU/HrcU family type III secretion system export apparatus switch protein [bacterium]